MRGTTLCPAKVPDVGVEKVTLPLLERVETLSSRMLKVNNDRLDDFSKFYREYLFIELSHP